MPPFTKSRVVFGEIWNLVTCHYDETMPVVEIRISFLEIRAIAVIRLSSISDVILTVRGIVDRMRPGVVDLRSEATSIAYGKAGLQRVVVRNGRCFELVDVEERSSRRRERSIVKRPRRRHARVDWLIDV